MNFGGRLNCVQLAISSKFRGNQVGGFNATNGLTEVRNSKSSLSDHVMLVD